MTFVVGVFDLFAYSVPGSLYLALLGYLAVRFNLVEPGVVGGAPGVLLVVGAVLLSYLLGYLAYPLGALADRVVPTRGRREATAEFLRRVPAAAGREYVEADPHLLLAGAQLHDLEAAAEVSRLRASGLMLRNAAPPLVLAGLTAAVEAFAGRPPVLAGGLAVVLVATGSVVIVEGRKLGRWARMKTLELCFWIPEVDERFRAGSPPAQS